MLDAGMQSALLEGLDEGVCMVNRDDRILYSNGRAKTIAGYLAQELADQFSRGVFEGCRAGGGDRAAIAHVSRSRVQ